MRIESLSFFKLTNKEKSMLRLFIQSWKGEASLAKAFWLVDVLFGIVVLAIISTITIRFMGPVTQSNVIHYSVIIRSIQLPYNLFSVICVWRCGKSSQSIWRILSRIVVITLIALPILGLFQLSRVQ